MTMTSDALISAEALAQRLEAEAQVILDAAFFLPRQQRNAQEEFKTQHIPGAQFFDIDQIADLNSPLPHTLPSAEQFAEQVGRMGIANDTWVFIYDNNHFFASARVWWMFRVFGHERVQIIDGGLTRWLQRGLPVTSNTVDPVPKQFNAKFRPELFADLHAMRCFQQQGSRQILDARSEDSFNGQRPISEAGLQPGHMPGSVNLPYRHFFDQHNATLVPVESLRRIFTEAGADFSTPMAATCGSGVSAALLLLALYQLGYDKVPMYDGSWAEWGRQDDLPREVA